MADKEVPKIYYKQNSNEGLKHLRWWDSDDEEQIHQRVTAHLKQLKERQLWRRIAQIRNARLYENMEILGLYASTIYASTLGSNSNRVKLNVCSSTVDTAASKIAKNKVRPYFLTNDSDWDLQDRAKKLTKFMDGQFDAMQAYPNLQRGFIDASVLRLGPTKIFTRDGKVMSERTNAEEIYVDDADAIYGKPSQLHQVRYVNRFDLANQFPKFSAKIFAAPSAFKGLVSAVFAEDVLEVTESWKLKSEFSSKDGIHAITIDGATLHAEKYKKNYFPFVFQRWKPSLAGFYGVALVDEIAGIQILIDRVIRMIEKGITTVAVPRVWLESTSGVNKNLITNLVGQIGEYSGTPPTIVPGQAFTVEIYEFLNMLIRWAYEFPGISQLSAQSKKPSGLDSGAALREYNEIESERFQIVSQRYEEAHLEMARIVIDKMKDLKEAGHDPEVQAGDNKFVNSIRWSEVDMEDNEYDLRVFPSSLLPTQPAGRMQKAIELVQAGFVEKDMAMSLLDFPDVESAMSLKTAAYDDVRMVIGHMTKSGEYIPPEPYMNLDLCISIGQSAYLRAKTKNAPEETLELLRRFIDDSDALKKKAQAQMTASVPQQAVDPMAVPPEPPTSDIMPVGGVA